MSSLFFRSLPPVSLVSHALKVAPRHEPNAEDLIPDVPPPSKEEEEKSKAEGRGGLLEVVRR